ncbi:hypothetical protein [Rhizobium sp. MHM7A]|uniref:hypothetical protein n=1 Tax=Rhizobium sp. MHM7A TaxID=2583233 RepID=UPI0011062772|nr:hypothetical protein [Rhizobium sp. MHM7A]TLX17104.1 hypothetical protein FFR93_07275 [Rhizobium sp. MHM7A]
MSDITDVESVVRWFLTDKDGNPHAEPTHNEADLRAFVKNMTTFPYPDDPCKRPLTPGRAWNVILDGNFLYLSGKLGWLDRDGKLFSCGWANHAKLLYWMGKQEVEVEQEGWVRINRGARGLTYRSCFKASPAQRRKLKSLGVEVDTEVERMLPAWTEQNRVGPISFENLGADADDYGRGMK